MLALVFLPPRSLQGFARRSIAGVGFGTVLAGYVRGWAGFEQTNEGLFEAAYVTGFISWWAMGALKRAVDAWKGPMKDQED